MRRKLLRKSMIFTIPLTAKMHILFSDDLEVRFKDITDDDLRKQVIRYHRILFDQGPYDIDMRLPFCGLISPIVPLNPEENLFGHYDKAKNAAKFAVEEINRLKNTKLQLDSLKKATFQATCGFLYYLTMVLTDSDSGEKKTYRAQVLDDIINEVMEMLEFFEAEVATGTAT